MPEFGLLKYFSEFCHEEVARGRQKFMFLLNTFLRLGAASVKLTAGIGNAILVFISGS